MGLAAALWATWLVKLAAVTAAAVYPLVASGRCGGAVKRSLHLAHPRVGPVDSTLCRPAPTPLLPRRPFLHFCCSLWALAHFRDLQSLYTAADSNLDVAALAWLQSLALACLLMHVAAPRRRFSGMVVPPHYTKVRVCR